MSERTFRGVVAVVLVLALVLAVMVAAATLYRPSPTPSPTISPTSQPTNPTIATPTPFSGPVFKAPGVISVGLITRGSNSDATLVIEFVESQASAIPSGIGSFSVRLADSSGDPSTVAFTGTPTVDAPGSLGATATFTAPGVLLIEIVASDPLNIEPLTIKGIGLRADQSTATGPVSATADGFSGSLEGGLLDSRLASPGTVVDPG